MDVRKNRTNLEYTDKTYVNEDGKTLCILTFKIKLNSSPFNSLGLTYEEVNKICKHGDFVAYGPFITSEYVEFQTIAQSSVNEGDKYDQVFGERLALTRAQSKAYMVAQLFYAHVANYFDKKAILAESFMDNCYAVWKKCLNHAQELEDNKYKK